MAAKTARRWRLAIASALAAALVYRRYRKDMERAQERLETGSRVVQTRSGPVECADVGQGPPVLVIHGAGGGFDQGLLLARSFGIDPARHRIVAPSRFGYLRTPLPPPEKATPAAQGAAHADLLDALDIEGEVAVLGVSAGAPSALELAIREPGRVGALILGVPGAWAPASDRAEGRQGVAQGRLIQSVVMRWDFPLWAFAKVAPGRMRSFLGVPKSLQKGMSREDARAIAEVGESILPVTRRLAGIENDGRSMEGLVRPPLEEVRAPTLVIDAKDMTTFPGAEYAAEHIPDATLLAFETGGHMLVGHGEETRRAVQDFLEQHARAGPRTGVPAMR